MIEEQSSWNSLWTKADKLASEVFVHEALPWALYQRAIPEHIWTL